MLGNRYSQHSFAQIPSVNMARSSFDRSHAVKSTYNFDELTPIFVDEIIPGDTMNLDLSIFARLQPQVVPVMDNMYLDFFFFFVPCRLVWDNWEKFCGAQTDPDDTTDYLIPTGETTGSLVGGTLDQMGIPPFGGTISEILDINVLPLRAYNLIWNEWFRDQNLQDSRPVPKGDGPDADLEATYIMQKRGRRHDYFASALPWPQKGPDVGIPLGTSTELVVRRDTAQTFTRMSDGTNQGLMIYTTGGSISSNSWSPGTPSNGATIRLGGTSGANLNQTGLEAVISEANMGTINALREAFQVQSLFELDARGGTRYTEVLMAHYKVVSPDFRLQRPEYLGGGQSQVNVHPVPQTSPTSGSNPQAQLAAFATASGGRIGFSKSFQEHGYVIGLMSARADITYQQGLNKLWTRQTRFDFFWPKLQELGEQPIYNKEIYVTGTSTDNDVFGYAERYAEYRFKPSEVRGKMRSGVTGSLEVYQLAEEFGSLPLLNADFIQSNTPIERALAVENEPPLIADLWFRLNHVRPMATYSVPASLGRF